MYGITGIKEQEKLEGLPILNKQTLELLVGKSGSNLDRKIERLMKKEYLLSLKKGWYVTQPFLNKQQNLPNYMEFLANKFRSPSYLSLDYALFKYNLIPEAINSWTSITLKSTRKYQNLLGSFSYRSIKKDLFTGYQEIENNGYNIYLASKAKALFDFIYLKKNLGTDLEGELKSGFRINWAVFSNKDVAEFARYVEISEMKKMRQILKIIKEIKNVN